MLAAGLHCMLRHDDQGQHAMADSARLDAAAKGARSRRHIDDEKLPVSRGLLDVRAAWVKRNYLAA